MTTSAGPGAAPGDRAPLTAHQRQTLGICCVGWFMVLLDVSIVNTALPTIQRDLHADLSSLQWVVDAYTLAFAALLLSWGTLADRQGRKRFFQGGMALFTLGSLLCGLAPSMHWLYAARALQGIGGAALAPTSLALLAGAFPDARQRVRAIALWAAVSGIALGVGPTIGGLLVVGPGWRWVFFVNVPVGVACLVFGVRVLRESKDPAARRIDLPGQLLSIGWLSALTYGFIEAGTEPWASPHVAVPMAVAAVLLAGFVVVEALSPEPMLPLGLFGVRLFSATAATTFLAGFVLISVPFLMAQYFQGVQGYSAVQAGVRVLAFTLMFTLFAPVAGRLAGTFGYRVPVAIGAAVAGGGLFMLSGLEPTTAYPDVAWRLALVGAGFGLMLSPLSATALLSMPPERSGLASSAANTTRQVGTVIGIALLGALVQTRATSYAAVHLAALGPARERVASLVGHGGAAAVPPGAGRIGSEALHHLAGSAFVYGTHAAFLIGGIVLFGAAAVSGAFLSLPRPATVPRPATEPAVTVLEPAGGGGG
ncbi:MAG TPA: MFS transporter [Acidimicrobiales bacterium]|nr:MFS transporter [Acidimicrobiales bacterium]